MYTEAVPAEDRTWIAGVKRKVFISDSLLATTSCENVLRFYSNFIFIETIFDYVTRLRSLVFEWNRLQLLLVMSSKLLLSLSPSRYKKRHSLRNIFICQNKIIVSSVKRETPYYNNILNKSQIIVGGKMEWVGRKIGRAVKLEHP
jgi:hypothetical protein